MTLLIITIIVVGLAILTTIYDLRIKFYKGNIIISYVKCGTISVITINRNGINKY